MPRTLRFGSRGPDVVDLQKGLNLLPSKLPRLVADGDYGGKSTARVRELQSDNKLVADGITGPMTWELFLRLLDALKKGTLPEVPASAYDLLRPVALTIAQQHFGAVDFSMMQGGKPKGIDFLIHMFQFAANATLTEANFRDENNAWTWTPWIGLKHQKKSWCGVFAVYCYKKAGLPVSWNLGIGGPVGPVKLNSFSSKFVANIRQADIGCVQTRNHHFLIESVDGSGPMPRLTTIDANVEWGRILRRESTGARFHQVGVDNFNYYSLG